MDDHILISDGEDQTTPLPSLSKRARKEPISAILISDSDPTPQKQPPESSSTPLFVPDTPFPDDFSVVKCRQAVISNRDDKFSGKRVISLDSEFEDSPQPETSKKYGPVLADFREQCRGLESGFSDADCSEANYENARIPERSSGKRVISLDSVFKDSSRPETSRKYEPFREPHHRLDSRFSDADSIEASTKIIESNIDDNTNWMHEVSFPPSLTSDTIEVDSDQEKENISIEKMARKKQIRSHKSTALPGEALPKKQLSKEEKIHAMEEKKLRKEQEKLQKAALKAEEAQRKKLEKEMQKWEKGKLALKSIVAEIDTKLVEGSIGGLLLSRFSEKGITFRVAPNPIERSIVWTMTIPEDIAPVR
ncbi:unnamed protein product [Microthlaspi erraticum]|uniref:ERCC4 domain-containing protein n=1 Tax=Microthlaspi erraticum TaxID=1685480 RepID=A0A6D2I128_9BRAS|nr:unnamed protein product [Microthlaspi erraticum]